MPRISSAARSAVNAVVRAARKVSTHVSREARLARAEQRIKDLEFEDVEDYFGAAGKARCKKLIRARRKAYWLTFKLEKNAKK